MYFEGFLLTCLANGLDVENEEKREGWKPITDQDKVTVNYILKHKLNLLFKEKGLIVFFTVCSLGRTY